MNILGIFVIFEISAPLKFTLSKEVHPLIILDIFVTFEVSKPLKSKLVSDGKFSNIADKETFVNTFAPLSDGSNVILVIINFLSEVEKHSLPFNLTGLPPTSPGITISVFVPMYLSKIIVGSLLNVLSSH